MDYLTQLRDVKSVITSIFSDIFNKNSNMKYTRLGEEAESQQNVNALLADMFDGENLKCELADIQEDSSSCNESSSLNGSIQTVCDKRDNTAELCADSSTDSGHNSELEDMPYKLVITYYFSFDTEEESAENGDYLVKESDDQCNISAASEDIKDNMFEDSSFCCDTEAELLEYSSVKNGSKNNLLDVSFGPELGDSINNVCLVDYDSASASEQDSDSDTLPAIDLDNVQKEDLDSDFNGDIGNVSRYCGNPAAPSMRKGYIYYSSEIRLYQGELRYEDSYSEKKFKLARKLFKKMFPSQKYVVNA